MNTVYAKETRVLVEKSDIPVAPMISVGDLQRLAQLEQEPEERFAVIDRIRERRRQRTPEVAARSA